MDECSQNIFEPGKVINGQWVILELIGKGGMGEVYRAHQLNLKRDVALKVISSQWLQALLEDEEEMETAMQRFKREVQAMARVRHPNVLQIFDYGSAVIQKDATACPVEFICMEYVAGNTLRHTMSEEGFYPEQELVISWLQDYFLPVLKGVQAIHDLDIVHRDLKPENIMLDGRTPKIADFGLARSNRLKQVTGSMEIKGTAHYMSPEHFFDFKRADQRADIYSLGKILFEALDGKMNKKIPTFKSVSLKNPGSPFFRKLDHIIRDATAEKKEERFDSVDRFYQALEDAVAVSNQNMSTVGQAASEHILRFPRLQLVWAAVAVVLVSMALMTLWHMRGNRNPWPADLKKPLISANVPLLGEKREPAAIPLKPLPLAGHAILAEDGASLRFVPGGKVVLPGNRAGAVARVVKVTPFYMDETPVTNHQYVEFLNRNFSRITTARGVVRDEEEVWLFLGEVYAGYEPMVLRGGKFKISNAAYASYPVLRVTPAGAAAYAEFYNRQLPTYVQWLFALDNDGRAQRQLSANTSGGGRQIDLEGMRRMMDRMMAGPEKSGDVKLPTSLHPLVPVVNLQPNAYGIRGLNGALNEWGLQLAKAESRDKLRDAEYVMLGGAGKDFRKNSIPVPVIRQPWEAFAEVGFRCVRSVRTNSTGSISTTSNPLPTLPRKEKIKK